LLRKKVINIGEKYSPGIIEAFQIPIHMIKWVPVSNSSLVPIKMFLQQHNLIDIRRIVVQSEFPMKEVIQRINLLVVKLPREPAGVDLGQFRNIIIVSVVVFTA
jgi:hypothetical protein